MCNQISNTKAATQAVLSTDLLGWIPCSEKMPKTGQRVLAYGYDNNPDHAWRFIAKWMPAGTLDAKDWDMPPDEWWDEEGEKCMCPFDAWWEDPYTTDNCSHVFNVTHWMELPSVP